MRRPGGRKRIGQMLIEKGLITEDQLNEALKTQQQTTQMLGEILVDLGYVQRAAFFETLAEQMGVSYVDLTAQAADIRCGGLSPVELQIVILDLIASGYVHDGGLGLYDTFVHYDIRAVPYRWDERKNKDTK